MFDSHIKTELTNSIYKTVNVLRLDITQDKICLNLFVD